MNTKPAVSLALLFFIVLNHVSPTLACGPFSQYALFSYKRHADMPLENYAAGKTGVVPHTYGRTSLFVFYRELTGKPLSAFEQAEVKIAMDARILGMTREGIAAEKAGSEKEDPHKKWVETRAALFADLPSATVAKERLNEDNYASFHSCLDDAFRTALKTLETRRAEHGTGEDLRNWMRGQDAVFANCGGRSNTLPEAIVGTAPDWLKRDRDYQFAAAHFYRDEFADARRRFEEVSQDKASPWAQTARFMLARTTTREADSIFVGKEWSPKRNADNAVNWDKRVELYRIASNHLRAIMSDPSMEYFHASARRLLARASYRADRDGRRNELAAQLSSSTENRYIYRDLRDYIELLDDAEEEAKDIGYEKEKTRREADGKAEGFYSSDYEVQPDDFTAAVMSADMTDWLVSYQLTGQKAYDHAYKKWKDTGSRAWLVSALSKSEPAFTGADDLLKAGENITAASPGFANARYDVVRLLIEKGDREKAKQKLEDVRIMELPVSSRNKYLGLRAALATNLNEYLRYAKRTPVGVFWDYDANETGEGYIHDDETESNGRENALAKQAWFDEDAVVFFSEKAPLSVIIAAAASPETPRNLKKLLYTMAWTRATVLRRGTLAQSMAKQVRQYGPEYGPALAKYVAAGSAIDRDAAGLIAMMRYPKVDANLPLGVGRELDTAITFDSNRGNWWCFEEQGKSRGPYDWYDYRYGTYEFKYPRVQPAFLTAKQIRENEIERKALNASGQSSTFFNKISVEFARANPNHPDTPEILHLAVRASRFGCSDDQTVVYSKQAFQFLHQRFPGNYWTKKTPYYFG